MKAFVIYTLLRLGLFVACFAVLGTAFHLLFPDASLLIPFVVAVVVSMVLSLKLLARQREEFARSVQVRAEKATANFEARRAREDAD